MGTAELQQQQLAEMEAAAAEINRLKSLVEDQQMQISSLIQKTVVSSFFTL